MEKAKKYTEEYVPFGEEWKKELMKIPKRFIIDLYRKGCIKNQQLELLKRQEKCYPDTEANGYVFCGKCGKMKDI